MSDYLQPWNQDAWLNQVDWENLDWASFDWASFDWASFDDAGVQSALQDEGQQSFGLEPVVQVARPAQRQPHVMPLVSEGPWPRDTSEDPQTALPLMSGFTQHQAPLNDVEAEESANVDPLHASGQRLQISAVHEDTATACIVPDSSGSDSTSRIDTRVGSQAAPTGSIPACPHRGGRPRKLPQALSCPHAACSYEGTFPRRYELQRHVAVKHRGSKPFRCPVVGCFKGAAQSAFARSDKLGDHIRSVHLLHTVLFCPSPACSWHLLSLDLLAVHISKAHFADYNQNTETLRAIVNAASPSQHKCPIWFCKKYVPLESFIEHVMLHEPAELESVVDDLAGEGYLAERWRLRDTGHSAFATDPHGSQLPIKRLLVVCPICSSEHRNHEDFADHLLEEHLVKHEHKTHFRAWLEQAEVFGVLTRGASFDPWSPWYAADTIADPTFCRGCNDYLTGNRAEHHFAMLQDTAELKLHRRQILRLYPNFISWTHVWDDLAHAVRCGPWQKTVVEDEPIDEAA